MKSILIVFICVLLIFIIVCNKKNDPVRDALSECKIDMTINETFDIFGVNYGVYKPKNISDGEIYVRRFEWLETSDTYFIKFSIRREDFKKLEESADNVLVKEPISQYTTNRSQRHNAPEWFNTRIEEGFKETLMFEKISQDKGIGDNLNLCVEVDVSAETYTIYLYCNYLVKW